MAEKDKERVTLDLSDEDEYVPDEDDIEWARKVARTRWWEV